MIILIYEWAALGTEWKMVNRMMKLFLFCCRLDGWLFQPQLGRSKLANPEFYGFHFQTKLIEVPATERV